MTLFRLASDLHLDVEGTFRLTPLEGDKDTVLILAGDLHPIVHLDDYEDFWRDTSKQFKEVLVVLGNHEYWGGDLISGYSIMESWLMRKFTNVYLLDNTPMRYPDCYVYGTTLWTDYNKNCPIALYEIAKGLRDFLNINNGGGPAYPEDFYNKHLHSRVGIRKFLYYADKPTVVVTHHAPSFLSISKQFEGSQLNHAFASDLSDFILTTKPNTWVHGHTHEHKEYTLGDTRVICNPRGYQPYEKTGFVDDYTFSVGE